MEVKPPEPLQKNFPRHPSAGVVPVLAPKCVLETVWVLILSNDPMKNSCTPSPLRYALTKKTSWK